MFISLLMDTNILEHNIQSYKQIPLTEYILSCW